MAKFVNISVISCPELYLPKSSDMAQAVEEMWAYLQGQIEQVLPDRPDLIVMPEEVDRYNGFTPQQHLAYLAVRGDIIRDRLCALAKEHNCYIAYSSLRAVPEDGAYPFRNSTQLIGRDGGVVGVYNKNHIVPDEMDRCGVGYGTEAPVFETDFGRVALAICFDLNFRELRARYAAQKPDLIVFCSMLHGSLMQQMWAFDCRAYFAGAICAPQRGRILNPMGLPVAVTSNLYNYVTARVNLDYAVVHTDCHHNFHMRKIRQAKLKYGDKLQVFSPDGYDATLLTYEGDDRTLREVMREFDIVDLDEYLDACDAHRAAHLPED